MNYCVYNLQTGEIEKLISGPAAMLELQYDNATHGLLAGDYTPFEYYVKNGVAIRRPTSPSNVHIFDVVTEQWIDPRSLDERKADKWGEIKAAREHAEYGGFIYNDMLFDSDSVSQLKIQGAVLKALLASNDFSIDWTLADNSVVTLSKVEFIDVGLALEAHVQICHAKARMLRQMINTAETAEELEAITWENAN